jgi:uncharacterized protein
VDKDQNRGASRRSDDENCPVIDFPGRKQSTDHRSRAQRAAARLLDRTQHPQATSEDHLPARLCWGVSRAWLTGRIRRHVDTGWTDAELVWQITTRGGRYPFLPVSIHDRKAFIAGALAATDPAIRPAVRAAVAEIEADNDAAAAARQRQIARRTAQRRAARQAGIDACPHCDEYGWTLLDGAGPEVRCDHPAAGPGPRTAVPATADPAAGAEARAELAAAGQALTDPTAAADLPGDRTRRCSTVLLELIPYYGGCMATLTLRVDDDVRDELERAARARGTTISGLLRAAIDDLLGGKHTGSQDRGGEGAGVPNTLDFIQRRTLALLHEILAEVADDETDKDHHQRQVKVMTEGFAGEYYAEFGFMQVELTPAECEQVHDILEMFQMLEISMEQLAPADRARLGDSAEHILAFGGFDLNKPAEARFLTFAKYLVGDEDRWTHFRERLTTGERGNSHSPRLARYQRMAPVYKTIRDKNTSGRGHRPDAYLFDVDDLLAMIEAARFPPSER